MNPDGDRRDVKKTQIAPAVGAIPFNALKIIAPNDQAFASAGAFLAPAAAFLRFK